MLSECFLQSNLIFKSLRKQRKKRLTKLFHNPSLKMLHVWTVIHSLKKFLLAGVCVSFHTFCRKRFQTSAPCLRMSGNAERGRQQQQSAGLWDRYGFREMMLNVSSSPGPSLRCVGCWGSRPTMARTSRRQQDLAGRSQRMYVQWPHPSLWTLYCHLQRARGQAPKSRNEHICPYSLLHSRLSTPGNPKHSTGGPTLTFWEPLNTHLWMDNKDICRQPICTSAVYSWRVYHTRAYASAVREMINSLQSTSWTWPKGTGWFVVQVKMVDAMINCSNLLVKTLTFTA